MAWYDPSSWPDKSTWDYSGLSNPSKPFVVDPLASDTRPEDTVVVDKAKLDRALTQYRQEQQAARTNAIPAAVYGAPGRQTQAPTVTTSPTQPTNYNVADRVLGTMNQISPPTWSPYGANEYAVSQPQQMQQQQMSLPSSPYSGLPQAPRPDKPFAYNIGGVQAGRVDPATWRGQMPSPTQASQMSAQDLEDYAALTGVAYIPPANQAATGRQDLQYDPNTRSWAPIQASNVYLPTIAGGQPIYIQASPQTMPIRDRMEQQYLLNFMQPLRR